jgi:hypothetical protein
MEKAMKVWLKMENRALADTTIPITMYTKVNGKMI